MVSTNFDRIRLKSNKVRTKHYKNMINNPDKFYNNAKKLEINTFIGNSMQLLSGNKGKIVILDTQLFQTTQALITAGINPHRIIIIEGNQEVYNHMIDNKPSPDIQIIYDDLDTFVKNTTYIISGIYADLISNRVENITNIITDLSKKMRKRGTFFAYTLAMRRKKYTTKKNLTLVKKEFIKNTITYDCIKSYNYKIGQTMLFAGYVLRKKSGN